MAGNYQLASEERAAWLQTENIWSSRQHQNSLWSPKTRESPNSELNSNQTNHKDWAAWRNEMQAISLDSPKKSCGTGFFLPRSADTDFQITSKSDPKRSSENWNNNVAGNKRSQRSGASYKTSSSAHYIYLPKEWTY